MSKIYEENKKLEELVKAVLRLEGKMPRNTSKEGHSAYVQLQRDIQTARSNLTFWQKMKILRDYEITRDTVVNIFGQDMIFKDMSEVRWRRKKH